MTRRQPPILRSPREKQGEGALGGFLPGRAAILPNLANGVSPSHNDPPAASMHSSNIETIGHGWVAASRVIGPCPESSAHLPLIRTRHALTPINGCEQWSECAFVSPRVEAYAPATEIDKTNPAAVCTRFVGCAELRLVVGATYKIDKTNPALSRAKSSGSAGVQHFSSAATEICKTNPPVIWARSIGCAKGPSRAGNASRIDETNPALIWSQDSHRNDMMRWGGYR